MQQRSEMQQRQGYQAVEKLRETLDEKYLWEVILLYAGESFKTYTGLPFTYEVRKGRNGDYTRELWIDRRENSKSLALSSVLLALRNIKKVGAVVDRPKALGDIRGVSYIYGMFYCFGLIDVPDTARQKMKCLPDFSKAATSSSMWRGHGCAYLGTPEGNVASNSTPLSFPVASRCSHSEKSNTPLFFSIFDHVKPVRKQPIPASRISFTEALASGYSQRHSWVQIPYGFMAACFSGLVFPAKKCQPTKKIATIKKIENRYFFIQNPVFYFYKKISAAPCGEDFNAHYFKSLAPLAPSIYETLPDTDIFSFPFFAEYETSLPI